LGPCIIMPPGLGPPGTSAEERFTPLRGVTWLQVPRASASRSLPVPVPPVPPPPRAQRWPSRRSWCQSRGARPPGWTCARWRRRPRSPALAPQGLQDPSASHALPGPPYDPRHWLKAHNPAGCSGSTWWLLQGELRLAAAPGAAVASLSPLPAAPAPIPTPAPAAGDGGGAEHTERSMFSKASHAGVALAVARPGVLRPGPSGLAVSAGNR
jgi:hypothetical protein